MNCDYLDPDSWSTTTSIERDRADDANLCECGHRWFHHLDGGAGNCRTVTVTGPPSPPDASAHLEHPGRNWRRCNCTQYQAAG